MKEFLKNKLYYYRYLNTKEHVYSNEDLGCEMDAQICSDIVYDYLTMDVPCMIARFGSTELVNLANFLSVKKGWFNVFRFIRGRLQNGGGTEITYLHFKPFLAFFRLTFALWNVFVS